MNAAMIRRADWVLSKCGRPSAPAGLSAVYLKRDILVQGVLDPGGSQTLTKEVEGDTAWVLRSISANISDTIQLYVQVLLPNGKFLINELQDVIQFSGFGSGRFVMTRELECPPGSKIQVTIDNSIPGASAAQPVDLCFHGYFKMFVRGGNAGAGDPLVSNEPRYVSHPVQNILAPSWMQGYYPDTPPGCSDDNFIYNSVGIAVPLAGPFAAEDFVQLEETSEFLCRRIFYYVTADEGITAGTFLVRARAASGYALMDDYIQVKYLQGTPFAVEWRLQAAENVIFDLILVDQAGTGTGSFHFKAYMEGLKRKRKI